MARLTRRQLLDVMAVVLPASSLLGCGRRELRPDERVCAHVYPRDLALPDSLLEEFGAAPARGSAVGTFTTGLPELFVCASPVPFLQLFPYFWPVETDELARARKSIRILFQVDQLTSGAQADDLDRWLAGRALPPGTVAVFTYNEFTRYFARRVLLAFRGAGVAEIVIFKDPRYAPYLCDAPARQKRFRRPPP